MAKENNVTRMAENRKDIPVRGAGPVASLRDEVNNLFDRFLGRSAAPRGARQDLSADPWWRAQDPFAWLDTVDASLWSDNFGQTDFSETDNDYEIQIDLPGLKRDDVTVDFADGTITVAGERSDEREDERKGYYLSERSHGYFRRSFRVPDNIDPDQIGAQFNEGVLTIRLPKTEEARRNTRRISVS